MADTGKPKSASKITDGQVKQLKIALKESANKYDELLDHIGNFQREEDKKRKGEIEDVINSELKSTHALCLKLQREIETIEHKSRAAAKSADGSKKNVSAFAADFRLTPEEQDIAYEFKAHVMRKIHSQNQNIKKELELHEKKVDLKKSQQAFKKQVEDQQKSQTTLSNLVDVYEKRALRAEKKSRECADQLKLANDVIDRYDQMYYSQGGDPGKMRHPPPGTTGKRGATPNDIIRRNEILVEENQKLRLAIQRVTEDNSAFLKQARRADAEREEAMHSWQRCDIVKQELQKRLENEKKQHKALKASFTNQTANWIQERKGIKLLEERERQDQLLPASPLAAQERLYQIPVKKNTDKPRHMVM
ncbi:tropomyosin-like [Watersipora subatra]|uniref:tropomyosin-like n=1 Tax=Watersipora subatra TaxID=2589382 RepID=UPI00355B752E